jgi:hypothetical protein
MTDRLLTPGFYAVDRGFYYRDPSFPPPPAGTIFVDPLRNAGPDAAIFRDPATGAERNASQDGNTLGTFTPHRVPLRMTRVAARTASATFDVPRRTGDQNAKTCVNMLLPAVRDQ